MHQSDDDVEVTDKVWVNGAKELTVTADSLAQNNYTGYTFDNYNPADIKEGMTVSDGDVIKVNYLGKRSHHQLHRRCKWKRKQHQ